MASHSVSAAQEKVQNRIGKRVIIFVSNWWAIWLLKMRHVWWIMYVKFWTRWWNVNIVVYGQKQWENATEREDYGIWPLVDCLLSVSKDFDLGLFLFLLCLNAPSAERYSCGKFVIIRRFIALNAHYWHFKLLLSSWLSSLAGPGPER